MFGFVVVYVLFILLCVFAFDLVGFVMFVAVFCVAWLRFDLHCIVSICLVLFCAVVLFCLVLLRSVLLCFVLVRFAVPRYGLP